MHKIILAITGFLLIVPAHAQEIADKIYLGGAIVTIDDAAPTADAVAVRDGRILAVGSVVLRGPLNGGNRGRLWLFAVLLPDAPFAVCSVAWVSRRPPEPKR